MTLGDAFEVSERSVRRLSVPMAVNLTFVGVFAMLLQFTQDVGAWAKETCHDLNADVARAFVSAGQAKEIDLGTFVEASRKADNEKFREEMKDLMRAAISGGKPEPKGPPGIKTTADGSGVEIPGSGRVDHTKAAGKRCLGEAMKCVFLAQADGVPSEARQWANNLLDKVYAEERVSYKVDDSGNLSETVERNGVSITRTGTESISGGPTYGFLVKPEWSNSVFRIPIEESVIEGAAFEVPVGKALDFNWPALDQYKAPVAGQSAAYAGFQLFRKGEITQRTYSDGALSEINYKITDLTAFTTLSRDLIADSYIGIDAMLQQVLGQAFQWKKDFEYINANGIGCPVGFLQANALLTQTRGTASHIEYEDIVGMMSKLHPACWSGARWVTNVACLPDLVSIKNHAGNLVYQPNSLIAQYMRPSVMGEPGPYSMTTFRAQGMLEGLPVYFTEKVPVLGTKGDLSLIHPGSYGIATRSGLEIGLSEHFLFDTDTIAYRFKLRNDGKPLWRAPYIQSDGGNTTATKVSPFVTLV